MGQDKVCPVVTMLTNAYFPTLGAVKKEPIVVGKPEEFMLANIAETFKLERHQICMVGDRLDTDVLFGQDGGLTTMLVLSGRRCYSSLQAGNLHCLIPALGIS